MLAEVKIISLTEGDSMAKARNLCRQDKKELKILASDFGLLDIEAVQVIIDTCKSYTEGQRAILKVYDQKYMR